MPLRIGICTALCTGMGMPVLQDAVRRDANLMNKVIGVDLGGTNLRAAVINTDTGSFEHLTSVPTLAREGHDAVMQRMALLIEQVIGDSGLKKSDIGGVGIGAPGVLALQHGLTFILPNLPGTWTNVP